MRPSGAPARTNTEHRPSAMTIRTRKLVGTILLFLFIALYALVAMAVAIVLQVNASKTAELAYYVIAGLLWVLPAGWLIRWMQKPDPKP